MREKSYRLRSSVLQDVLKGSPAQTPFRISLRIYPILQTNAAAGLFQHPASSNLDWTANFLEEADSLWDVAEGVWPDPPVVSLSRGGNLSPAPH